MSKYLKLLAASVAFSSLVTVLPANAQSSESANLEEIIVTGRNREESLQEVPVSASVLSETFIDDAGLNNLYDLFEMVPGLHYDEQIDRLGAQPSVRGVQANEISTNRVKVSAFIDGMPVLGSQGSIGFNSFQQVEVYRGPQSAAFGRSTFAGAINYITKDPSDTFEASIGVDASDYGTRILDGSLSGPITDSLGYMIQFEHEDSGAPSEWSANGDDAYFDTGVAEANVNQSDGTEFGARTGDNISAKLVFEPSDTFRTAVTFGHVETHDQRNPELYLTEQARNECFEGNGIRADEGMGSTWLYGTMNCDWDSFRKNYANHDDEQFLMDNPLLLADLVANAVAAGAVDGTFAGTDMTVQEQILAVARAYSIPVEDRGSKSERDRVTLQSEKIFDSGAALNFSYMHNEETQNRINDVSVYYYEPVNVGIAGVPIPLSSGAVNNMAPGVNIQWDYTPMGGATRPGWTYVPGGGAPRVIMATPATIEEDYAELRWVSPSEDRLRYVVGTSFYDYSFLENSYGAGGMGVYGVGYGALLNDMVDEYEELTNMTFEPDNYILGENATNSAVFFNLNYDLTDDLSVSAEGRYQIDKVGATNAETGVSAEETTESFLPRLAVTYNFDEDTTVYLQWSKGVNPAGINVGMLNQTTIDSLDAGITNALIPYDAALDTTDILDNDTCLPVVGGDQEADAWNGDLGVWNDSCGGTPLTGTTYSVGFDSSTFLSYKEEQLTNIEFGFKGNLLDGRLSYASAVYMIDWKDQLQNGTIQWDSPCADGQAGVITLLDGPLGPCTYEGTDYLFVGTDGNASENGVGLNYGDVKIKGVELETSYSVSDNWNVRATASYLEAEYDSYCDIAAYDLRLDTNPGYVDALDIEVLIPGPESTISSPCNVSDGKQVAGQPELTYSISPSYTKDLASGLRFGARMDIRYEGERWLQSGNYAKYAAITNTNLSFSLSSDNWSVTLYANNLTDENSPRQVFSGGDDTDIFGLIDTDLSDGGLNDFLGQNWDISRDNFRFAPRIPRTVGLRASYRF